MYSSGSPISYIIQVNSRTVIQPKPSLLVQFLEFHCLLAPKIEGGQRSGNGGVGMECLKVDKLAHSVKAKIRVWIFSNFSYISYLFLSHIKWAKIGSS